MVIIIVNSQLFHYVSLHLREINKDPAQFGQMSPIDNLFDNLTIQFSDSLVYEILPFRQ